MAQNEDPYDVLLVSRSATASEIRKSYQELAKKVNDAFLHVYFVL